VPLNLEGLLVSRSWGTTGTIGENKHVSRRKSCMSLSTKKITHMGKGKAIPLKILTGPEGSRRLRLSDFKTIGT
jgi:hypothetical protein